jgi:hypothetical protein
LIHHLGIKLLIKTWLARFFYDFFAVGDKYTDHNRQHTDELQKAQLFTINETPKNGNYRNQISDGGREDSIGKLDHLMK